ncbi:MAG: 4-hydroxy-tetrahydrodipicolinate synthase [Clostridiales bacterium]|nr:4-hydroxy-tetrahydrodipicolinate synthase [Clostridiales bacterium]
MKKLLFTGVGTALITPMNESGKINFDTLKELIDFQVDNRADALVIAGTTGEASTLSDYEYEKLISSAVEYNNHRIPLIAGAGSNDTAKAIKKAKVAAAAGADGLLSVTPYYNKTSQFGLTHHFSAIASAVELPIILYNVPSRTGLNITPETCQELSQIPNIVGLKDAASNITQTAKVSALCGDELPLYSGNDDQVVPILSLGGKGVISVLSNIIPQVVHQMCESFFKGNLIESQKLQLEYLPLITSLFSDVNPIPIKAAVNFMGFVSGECRPPLAPFSLAGQAELLRLMKFYHIL